jgi:hypothetical protein
VEQYSFRSLSSVAPRTKKPTNQISGGSLLVVAAAFLKATENSIQARADRSRSLIIRRAVNSEEKKKASQIGGPVSFHRGIYENFSHEENGKTGRARRIKKLFKDRGDCKLVVKAKSPLDAGILCV